MNRNDKMVYKPHVAVLAEKLKAGLTQVQAADQVLEVDQLEQWGTDGGKPDQVLKAGLTQVQAADQALKVDQLEQWGTDGGKPNQVLEEVQ